MARVVTSADVAALGADVTRLEIGPGDVISPSAIDAARARGISVEHVASPARNAPETAGSSLDAKAVSVSRMLEERIHREVKRTVREAPGEPLEVLVDRAMRRLASEPPGEVASTVTERLASFVTRHAAAGVPDDVRHEARRLILNNLKASILAFDHELVAILLAGAEAPRGHTAARVIWHGLKVPADQAALVNSVQMEVLDYNETHVPTYVHLSSQVLPAVLAVAESRNSDGAAVLDALAIGIDVELAISTMLMPTVYERGFLPGVIAGTVGAAAGCAAIMGLDFERTCNALAIAMLSAGGLFEAVGSMTASLLTGNAARTGLKAALLAERGVDGPTTAFEGEKGMLLGFSVEEEGKIDHVLSTLGKSWRTKEGSYKRFQAETIDQAPLQALFTVRDRTPPDRLEEVDVIRFRVEPLVANIAQERYERFGTPQTDLQATFDLRYVMAAAWVTGQTGGDVYTETCYRDPEILRLRDLVEVKGDPAITLDGAGVVVHFADGSRDEAWVDTFRGSTGQPFDDSELEGLFRAAAASHLSANRTEEIISAVWSMGPGVNVNGMIDRLVVGR